MPKAAVGQSVTGFVFFLYGVRETKVKQICQTCLTLLLLHQDGIISVKDIDLVMSEGLGMRYAFIGPMETMHLNAPEGKVPTLDQEPKTN